MTIVTATPISTLLRDGTATAHSQAENTSFMSALGSGNLTRQDAVNLTAQYYFIYTALEQAARRGCSADPEGVTTSRIADPRLERVPALERDLAAMIGPDWREQISPLPATRQYVATLEHIPDADAPALIAHHYVRYLGDIAGGQVIARVLAGHYGFTADELNFYDFSAIGKIPPYRKQYKDTLDSLPFDEVERASLLSNARQAFTLNSRVFIELAG